MSSILQTDVFELYNSWGERVAFNEGFQAQKIADAKQAGRDAFSLGIDRSQGQGLYFEAKDQRFSEAKDFLAGESVAQISDDSDAESESIEPDQIGDVTDGEETLGMESCVANETEYLHATGNDNYHGFQHVSVDCDEIYRSQCLSVANETDDYDPMLDAAGVYDLDDLPPSPHQDEFHEYLHETRDIGESFVGYHEWHSDNYGDFGIR